MANTLKCDNNNFLELISKDSDFFLVDGIFRNNKNYSVSYPENGNEECFQIEDSSFWFKHRNKLIIEQLRIENPSGLILDVGGGNGFVTSEIQKEGFNVILVEPYSQGCLNAVKRGVKNVINSNLADLKISKSKVEIICAFDVIEHISDDNLFIQTCYDSLDLGGKLFVAVPSFQFLWSKEDESAGHYRRYSRKQLIKLIESNGFNVKYCSYLFSFLTLPILLIRTLPDLFHFRIPNKVKSGKLKTNKLFDFFCLIEGGIFSKRRFIPFGSSLFLVAEK